VVNNLARAVFFAIVRGGVPQPAAKIGLFGVLRSGVDAINLTGVEAYLAGVQSETTALLSSSG
jgi:hypothetical protein